MSDQLQNRSAVIGNSAVSIGRFTYGIENLHVRQWGEGAGLKIGSFCSLADNITIFLGGNHRTDWITTYPFGHVFEDDLGTLTNPGHPSSNGNVVIGHDVWIGSGVTIMSGLTIGDGACIAANACVVKDVPPYHITGGNPARTIRARFDSETIGLLLQLHWWDLPLEDIKRISRYLCSQPDIALLMDLLRTYRT
jgi:acetyltransferase-like isoleucine patch superfamily enzyme